ncbi:GNAT family N-acetyltransferase [Candidatus Roizmanbacteria bacterium]|nr:GNAT family N-acetyltransferase [Candidatus Roizmanbacteria bacterium]
MDLEIKPLNKSTYEDAVRIAIVGNTGLEKDIRKRLKEDHYFVAVDGDKVVGEIGWYQDNGSFAGEALGDRFPYGKNIYWLGHFAVDRPSRNKGIGKLLLKYLEDIIKGLGGRELWVYTDQARGFYEKNGFVFVKKAMIEDCWQDVLKKDLT